MDIFLTCIFIFFARIADVTFGTLKTLFVIRGNKKLSFVLGFIEILIWYIVVSRALGTGRMDIFVATAYSLGYATGAVVGAFIEEKLAIGQLSLQVIVDRSHNNLVNILRENGYAVSTVDCAGLSSLKTMLIIEINRKELKKVKKIIHDVEPGAFLTISDTRMVINGYFEKK